MWRREKTEEILIRSRKRSIYIEKYIETLSNNGKSTKNNIIDICRGLTRYTDISLQWLKGEWKWMREAKLSNIWTSWIKVLDNQWDDGSTSITDDIHV